MIGMVRVSSRGQVVIPEDIRNEADISEGTKLVIIEKGGTIILEKEKDFLSRLDLRKKEDFGWLVLAEKSMHSLWDNEKDDKTWSKYI